MNSGCYTPITITVEDCYLSWFRKAFVGFVENPGISYNMQEIFNVNGYFSILVTPLWGNICLLEDKVYGELKDLLINGKQWFKEARPWKPTDVGDERISWIFYYGIPFQVWKPEFFVTLVKSIGKYLCLDDAIRLHILNLMSLGFF